MPSAEEPWRLFVDTGGTFTDCLAVAPDGRRLRRKVLSSADAPIRAARIVTGASDGSLPTLQMRLGTTRGTNALLEKKGGEVVFFVTEGFGDLLCIGDQRRPELFTLNVQKPEPLYATVVEVPGRLDAKGNEIAPLDLGGVRAAATDALQRGQHIAAVCLLHSYLNDTHESTLKSLLDDLGFEQVSVSSEVAPFIKAVPRAETTVIDAYLRPAMDAYLNTICDTIGENNLRVMTSAGGLISRENFCAKDSLLSGPAGGVVGAAACAERAGSRKVIAFDMGGTSTDVSRIDGNLKYCESHAVGRVRLMAPALKIETVAAGGGSICGVIDGGLFVGPESAGANPGPACYGQGGPLTITDVNLLVGRIDFDSFNLPVHPDAAEARLAELPALSGQTREQVLMNFLALANERMTSAVRRISVREGYDPADHVLVAFGGAGGQHACAVAETLGMSRILFPADAGLLSAFGIQQARVERVHEAQLLMSGSVFDVAGERELAQVICRATDLLEIEGVQSNEVIIRQRTAMVRFAGQESVVAVDFERIADVQASFHQRYRATFGYVPDEQEIEIVSLRVLASSPAEPLPEEKFEDTSEPHAQRTANICFDSGWVDAPVYERRHLEPGHHMHRPGMVVDEFGTLIIEPGWRAVVGSEQSLLLERNASPVNHQNTSVASNELMENRLLSMAAEMGAQLERTAISTNIRERLDFSCAVLDAGGRLIVNAPHIPVHLGALGLCVREVAERLEMAPGDLAITNHPACGGSHLPDVTVMAAVFDDVGERLGYVANRAHHAEIGGIAPGSMSPAAQSLAEEGVVIAPMYLFRQGESRWADLRNVLSEGEFPTRQLKENMADLQAQVAALRMGNEALKLLAKQVGADAVRSGMAFVHDRAERAIAQKFAQWDSRDLRAVQTLDNGAVLSVRITIVAGRMEVDFTGTTAAGEGNLHATPAIVRSVMVYVLRLLVDEEMPLNEGLLAPVEIVLPECLLNPRFDADPARAPAVFGGNVEVSQRLVDALLLAFEAAACGQGTMNNLVIGDATRSYYETIGGGSGAGKGFGGASGIHVHMSNTAITDPEILERRFPVLLRQFALRQGSGGHGQWRGGEGLVREIEFLEPQTVSLLGQNRSSGPKGLAGGEAGACGAQRIVRRDGLVEDLEFAAQLKVAAGDRLVIETPGGGGFGSSDSVDERIRVQQ